MQLKLILTVATAGLEREVPVGPEGFTEFGIGRGTDSALFLNHPTVSRKHCRIVRRGRAFVLEDLGSSVGTLRNGQRLTAPVELSDGDVLTVGEVSVRVRLVDEEAEARRRAEAVATLKPGAVKPVAKAPPPPPTPPAPRPEAPKTVRLPAAAAVDRDRTFSGPSRAVETGPASIPLDGKDRVVLGRGEKADVTLENPMISRAHAEVRRDGARHLLVDLGSTNGTFVNGERVAEPRPLAPGDVVRVGPFTLGYDGHALSTVKAAEGTRIEVRGVGKQVNDRATGKPLYLLNGVSLTILPREFVGLLGSSGCGKSTFMDTVNGRRPATEGTVLYDGRNLYDAFDAFKRGIGYVPQELIFHDELPVADALRYASRLRLPDDTTDEEIERNIDRVLGVVNLKAARETLVKHLSGGQKKRVSIAMELLSRPTVLFLDEATSGLDLGTEAQMMRLFRDLADGGVTTLCITHYVDSLELCDVVAYFVKGRLAFFGPPAELKRWFGVERIRDVYGKEGEKTPEQWEAAFRASPAYETYVRARATPEAPADATRVQPGQALEQVRPKDPRRQTRVLGQRYVQLIKGDKRALRLALIMAPVIGLLAAFVLGAKDKESAMELAKRQGQLTFMLTISTFFFGLLGSFREVVKELAIYRHERFVNLEIVPYLVSKIVPLAVLGAIQTTLLLGIVHVVADVRAPFLGQWIVLFPTYLAAMLLGLAVSCAVDTNDKAVLFLLFILIPQLLFSNAFIQLDGFGKALGMVAILCYWANDGLKSMLPDEILKTSVPGTGGVEEVWNPALGQFVPQASGGRPVLFGHHGWALDLLMILVFAALYGGLAFTFLRKKDGPYGRPYQIPWIKSGTWIVIRTRAQWLLGRLVDGLAKGVSGLSSGLQKLSEKTKAAAAAPSGLPPPPPPSSFPPPPPSFPPPPPPPAPPPPPQDVPPKP